MKRIRNLLVSVTLLLSIFVLSSCVASGQSSVQSAGDYMTREEVEALIQGIEENVTVNAGNNYDISIDSGANQNLLAASKGLLSAVSIKCKFKVTVTYTSLFGQSTQTYTTEKETAGAGVIYKLDKEKGDAYVITNYHVVYYSGADTADDISDEISLYLYGQEYSEYAIAAEYIGGSKNYDIAVLKVKSSDVLRESNARAVDFANSDKVCVLDTAIAIGNPEAVGISATVGAVNVDSENLVMTAIDGVGQITLRVMRIDAAVNGGNSGGGLFDDNGNLIGIVNAKMSSSSIDNIGYAIPSNVAKNVADNIIYYDNEDAKNDSVKRILIGVNVGINSAGTYYDTETGRVHKVEEVRIDSVTAGGLSDGKLFKGDILKSVSIDGETYSITRTYNVIDVMLNARRTSEVVFVVVRGGAEVEVKIDLSSAPLTDY